MVDEGFKAFDVINDRCGLSDGIELADQGLLLVTAKAGTEKGTKSFPIEFLDASLGGLKRKHGCIGEVHGC